MVPPSGATLERHTLALDRGYRQGPPVGQRRIKGQRLPVQLDRALVGFYGRLENFGRAIGGRRGLELGCRVHMQSPRPVAPPARLFSL